MKKVPRPYQIDFTSDIDEAWDVHRAVCGVLPTGGGKTLIASLLAAAIVSAGSTVWGMAHRYELVEQISGAFTEAEVSHGLIMPGMPLHREGSQVGTIQTIKNKLHLVEPPDYLFIDECHHTPASQYVAIINAMPAKTRVLGLTATPCRLDGRGLSDYYTKMILGPSIADLISLGYLVQPKVHAPQLVNTDGIPIKYGDYNQAILAELMSDPIIIGDCVEYYKELAYGTSAAVFCAGIANARKTADVFNRAGIPAMYIAGDMSKFERASILRKFKEKEILILCSSDLISEGFDCPGIETVIFLRPTKSLSLYLQMIGRGLRPMPGKAFAIIIDHVGNRYRHGSPTAHRSWSLEGVPPSSREKDEDAINVKTCSVCFLVYEGKTCPDCAVEELSGRQKREIKVKAGKLVEIEEVDHRKYLTKEEQLVIAQVSTKDELESYLTASGIKSTIVRDFLIRSSKNLDDLKRAGKLLGYANGWAEIRYKSRFHEPVVPPLIQTRLPL